MPPTRFPYRANVIRRSLWVNAACIALGLLYVAVAQPFQWHWVDIAMLFGLAFYGARFIHDLLRLMRPLSAIVLSDEGVRDPAFGNALVPWQAIKEIRIGRMRGLGQIFLIAEAARLSASPGGLALRFANWVRGARPGRSSADMVLPMSQPVALDASVDDIMSAMRSRPQTAHIKISDAATDPGA